MSSMGSRPTGPPPPAPKRDALAPTGKALPPIREKQHSSDSFPPITGNEREHLLQQVKRVGDKVDQTRGLLLAKISDVERDVAEHDARLKSVELGVAGIAMANAQLAVLNQSIAQLVSKDAQQDTRIEAMQAARKAGAESGEAAGHEAGMLAASKASRVTWIKLAVSTAVTAGLTWLASHYGQSPPPPPTYPAHR